MPISTAGLNVMANALAGVVTHIALFDNGGIELAGGTYARLPVAWTAAANGDINPTADLVFQVPAGVTVAEWRGFSALTVGTDYGGAALTPEAFAAAGEYTLTAALTGYDADPG